MPRKLFNLLIIFVVAAIVSIALSYVFNYSHQSKSVQINPLAAGATTAFNRTSTAYEQPSAGLSEENLDKHIEGDFAFEAVFVTPPADINPGLGPLFNNASCAGCHIRNGRGLPTKGQLLVRVSNSYKDKRSQLKTTPSSIEVEPQYHLEASVEIDNAPPVARLGTQIQDQGVYGYQPEANIAIQWQEEQGEYADGTKYQLRSPQPEITLANGEPLADNILTSLRIPPPVIGLGLLEAVPAETFESMADPEDQDNDGISGRTNQVWDVQKQATTLGLFGWKANNPTLLQQSASAYANDMGVTNPMFTEADGSMDIDQEILDAAAFYVQTLAVPARTLIEDAEVRQGEKLFA
jgi:CxxC motif-containing protein (DUF1111 family)